jgi:ATP-dependent Clp protease adaptor protein ClpS
MLPPQFDHDEAVLTESETKVRKPPLYKVLLHNDDFTTMEFVVYILETVFGHPEQRAIEIMLAVHTRGVGVAGIYPFEVAEMKVARTTSLAQANEYPLMCTTEEE